MMDKQKAVQGKTLLQRAVSGTMWNLSCNLVAGFFRFGSTAVAAHYLCPSDFGIFAIAYVVIGILALFKEYGLSAFLIHKSDCDDEYYCTAFWLNVGAGIMLFVLCVSLSPLVSTYYKNETLRSVFSVIALNFIISEISVINNIRLQKELMFHLIGVVEVIRSGLQAIIVIILAMNEFGVWSLVWAVIIANSVASFLLIYIEKWRPRWLFSRQKFVEIFKFGRNLLGESWCNYLSQNLDYLIIGRMLGMDSLGLYKLAYGLPHLIYENFPKKISPVLYPLLCSLRGNITKYREAFIRPVSIVSVLAFPMLTYLAYNSHDIILLLYGQRWLSMVPLVRIMTILAMFRCVGTFVGAILNSHGRPDIGFKINVFKLPLFVLGIFVSVSFYGLPGVCWTMASIEGFSVIAVYVYLSKKFKGAPDLKGMGIVTSKGLILATVPICLMALLTSANLGSGEDLDRWIRLGETALVWIVSWFSIYAACWRDDLVEFYRLSLLGLGLKK